MTMKIKNVVANGKTQRVTLASRTSVIKTSQLSTIISIKFCIPDGISLMFFQVVTRTMTRIIAATIQEQIIELDMGSAICFGHHPAKIEGTFLSGDGPRYKSAGAASEGSTSSSAG